jgi:preprotein translocase subunit SecA
MNKQREVIYGQRREILEGASLKEDILEGMDKILSDIFALYISDNSDAGQWDTAGLVSALRLKFGLELDASIAEKIEKSKLKEDLCQKMAQVYAEKEKSIGAEMLRHLERMVFLQIIDSKWKDHLYAMDSLREGIGLRAYGQRDPLIEYKREAFEMFAQMMSGIEEEAIETLFKLQPVKPERFRGIFSSLPQEFSHPEVEKFERPQEEPVVMGDVRFGAPRLATPPSRPPIKSDQPKAGRNDPCPCGSGKKFKKCCGK